VPRALKLKLVHGPSQQPRRTTTRVSQVTRNLMPLRTQLVATTLACSVLLGAQGFQLPTTARPLKGPVVSLSPDGLSHVEKAWRSKTIGAPSAKMSARLRREAKTAWLHVRAARLALSDGAVSKARASYNYYLKRFQNNSAVLVTDVYLRLAVMEHNAGNESGARHAFRQGARLVTAALNSVETTPSLRERAAALYCSWGLHEYSSGARLERSVSLFRHAARIDASKAPILNWRRFDRRATRLSATATPTDPVAALPGWKTSQLARYSAMAVALFDAAARRDDARILDAAQDFETRLGARAPARSPRLSGAWRLAYSAPYCCACSKQQGAATRDVVVGTRLALRRVQDDELFVSDEQAALFRVTTDNTISVAGAALNGTFVVTYLDDNVLILRRARCGSPLVIFERADP